MKTVYIQLIRKDMHVVLQQGVSIQHRIKNAIHTSYLSFDCITKFIFLL
jgi:hypothetical protein